jgi:RHS repeat-associated protein
VTSTEQFVWCGNDRCEARNAAGSVTAQYFLYGQTIGGSNYFYTKDQPPGSIRELTDSSGNMQAQYGYDPYGRVTKLQGSLASDFQYAGYYFHAPSGLSLTKYRNYRASLGRWLNRDPIGEVGGVNLYAYVRNEPIGLTDPLGVAEDSGLGGYDECIRYCWAVYQNDPPNLLRCLQWCAAHKGSKRSPDLGCSRPVNRGSR